MEAIELAFEMPPTRFFEQRSAVSPRPMQEKWVRVMPQLSAEMQRQGRHRGDHQHR